MTDYILTSSTLYKAQYLVEHHNAIRIEQPKSFEEIPDGKQLVCVVSNGKFDAARIVDSDLDFEACANPGNTHGAWWLLLSHTENAKVMAKPS